MSDKSAEGEFSVRRELGMHARPAGLFVTLAGRFECEVSVSRDSEWVSGTSVLSILSLAASKGTVLRIRAVGSDAEAAVRALGELIESEQEDPPSPGTRDAIEVLGSLVYPAGPPKSAAAKELVDGIPPRFYLGIGVHGAPRQDVRSDLRLDSGRDVGARPAIAGGV